MSYSSFPSSSPSSSPPHPPPHPPGADISSYCKFKLGSQRYKSRVLHKTVNPDWKEQFDLRMYDGESSILHIEVWDRKIRYKDKFMGRYGRSMCLHVS